MRALQKKLPAGYTEAEALAERTPQGLSADECWPWQGSKLPNGYGAVRLPSGEVTTAHRLAWALANGREPQGRITEQIRHRCDNRPCVNPSHLEIGTLQENMADMVSRERSARGERSGKAKLTECQVLEIRRRLASGESSSSIGVEFGVHERHVRLIGQRKTWRHI